MYQKGDVVLVDLGVYPGEMNPPKTPNRGAAKGREQGGVRPCLVLAYHAVPKLALIAPRTTSDSVKGWPYCVETKKGIGGLDKDGYIMLHQIRTVTTERIIQKMGRMPEDIMAMVDTVLDEMLDL